MAPKISVIIPVYNTQEYLEQCLDSVLGQSMQEVEVICVDDCSKDASYQIMEEYHRKDSRVKIFRFDEPKSALQARKVGVMAAEGEYILFLDADDFLEPEACQRIYEKIKQENVDILHFSSRVLNCANLPQSRIDSNQKLLKPFEGRLEGKEVFEACFKTKKYFFTLWNKLMNAQLCKKAFGYMEDKYLPKAQDLYSFFVISYFAKSYLGWVSEPMHNYCLGRGVVGSASMNLDKFERYCTQKNIVTALRTFAESQKMGSYVATIIDNHFNQWIEECIRIWLNELPKELAADGLEILYRYWGSGNVISHMAKLFWYQRTNVARKLRNIPHISLKNREVKTIAIYYYHFTTGGVQRVISLLTTMFIKLGYRVVIITDSEPTDEDFPLPEGAIRANIFTRDKMNRDVVQPRMDSWDELMEKYHFDMVFYHAWTSNVMLWDFLYLKSMGVPVVVHAHSVFSFAVNKFQNIFFEIVKILPVADGLVVLSDADKVFWDAYVDNVYMIPNPVSGEQANAEPGCFENKALVWVARVSDEKQPSATFAIMEKVVRRVPDAKLYLVGNFDDPKWQQMAVDKNVENNVVFCGLTHNVGEYYKKASIHLSTSKYEGFMMTLLESQAHCLPTVMFRMPNLTIGTPECGAIGVDMHDYASAADEIVKLMTNREHWEYNSRLARKNYEKLAAYDFEAAWKRVIAGEVCDSELTKPVKDMIHTFVNHYEEGYRFDSIQKKKQQQTVTICEDPVSYKIGRFITLIPRKIRGTIQCCKDHGFKYTVKHALERIKSKFVH